MTSKGDPRMSQCSITGCSGYGAYIKDGGLGCFRGCEFSAQELSNVFVETSGNPLFDACRIHDNAGGNNVFFGAKAKGQMMDCHIFQGVNECVVMKSCAGSILRACSISKTTVGVRGSDDARGEMFDCTIADVEEACCVFGFRADVSLERCKMHSSSKHGMMFAEGAVCKLIDCSVYNCAQCGSPRRHNLVCPHLPAAGTASAYRTAATRCCATPESSTAKLEACWWTRTARARLTCATSTTAGRWV